MAHARPIRAALSGPIDVAFPFSLCKMSRNRRRSAAHISRYHTWLGLQHGLFIFYFPWFPADFMGSGVGLVPSKRGKDGSAASIGVLPTESPDRKWPTFAPNSGID
jgi:hypothetical protein